MPAQQFFYKSNKITGGSNKLVRHLSDWENLPQSEKDKYETVDVTEEYQGIDIDDAPTQGSNNLVKSGGVYSYINTMITQAINASY